MTDYCLPENQIGNYTPSSNGVGDTLTVRNIDCMSLDSYIVEANKITVDGYDVSVDVVGLANKTQHQSATATPVETTFTGEIKAATLDAPYCVVDEISTTSPQITIANNVSCGNITSNGPLTISNPSTSAISLLNLLQPNLGTGAKTSMKIGKADSTSNCAEVSFTYSGSGSTNNFAQIGVLNGTNYIRLYPSVTVLNGTVQANTQPLNPTFSNSLTTTSAAVSSPVTQNISTSNIPAGNVRCINFIFTNFGIASTVTPSLRAMSTGSTTVPITPASGTYVGMTGGNNGGANTTWTSVTSDVQYGVLLHNQPTLPASSCRLTGQVTFTRAGTHTGTQEVWSVSGYTLNIPPSGTKYYTSIAGMIYMTATSPLLTGIQLAVGSQTTGAILTDSSYTITYN